ncbi:MULTISPECIES: YsaB family lipoprotein [Enterobacteriaceae]|uniref:YsaB family lipoprotein n=1 Tax=Enterobacteriaceae TaxID=543 RepID=UPI000AB74223|nr:YsaB family lipoprotein [Phytobacter diazotrophicus]MDU4995358.1 YsaB family lipoprotein [Enterobacteriaceae bacterium]MDV2901950.1 YsaB family lipoprotein [Phytobacter diazotrophicus]
MMIKNMASALLVLLVAGCSAPPETPAQRAQKAKVSPAHSLEMEQLCKQSAAHRYNTDSQAIAVTSFEQFQSSYEMRGVTPRKEGFVCSFDPEGQFLHLSMR